MGSCRDYVWCSTVNAIKRPPNKFPVLETLLQQSICNLFYRGFTKGWTCKKLRYLIKIPQRSFPWWRTWWRFLFVYLRFQSYSRSGIKGLSKIPHKQKNYGQFPTKFVTQILKEKIMRIRHSYRIYIHDILSTGTFFKDNKFIFSIQ